MVMPRDQKGVMPLVGDILGSFKIGVKEQVLLLQREEV